MKNYKILLVEDDSMVFLTLQLYLKNLSLDNIYNVTSGEDAIDFFRESMPDIIIMDILLSGKINGIEAAKTILSEKRVPIIFMTGYSINQFYDEIKKLNPVDFLMKPIPFNKFKKSIEDAIEMVNLQENN